MNTQLTATQIFDLMSEQPGSAEGRDAARAAVARLDPSETKVLVQRIVDAAQPESPDHPAFAVPFVRGYLLGQLGKIVEENKAGINLLLRHVQPEFEPDHWVRYWAFTGCIAAGTPKVTEVAQWALRQFGQGDPGPDHKLLVLSCAVFWAQKRDPQWETHLTTPLRAWLQAAARGNGQVPLDIQGRCQDVLRVLEICPVLPTVGLVTEVLNRQGSDPRTRLLAVQALGALPEAARAERGRATRALLTFVQNSGNTRTLAGVRRAAVEALGDLGLADAEYLLLKELRAGSLDMIKAAARALVQVIGLEKAVQRILEASLADNNPHSRNNYAISLRWMSEDKAAVTDLLHQSLATGSPDQEEITRTLMAEMGGSAAVQKLSARKKAVDDFKTMLLGEQDKFQKRFDETMEEARTGFRIAISMDVVVFGLGIVMLVAFMIYAFITDTVDNFVGVGLGGLGTLGVVYGTLIANPRKKVFRSVNTLMNFKVIFLAYLRQLHQADQTFTRHLLEDEQLTTDKLEEFSSMIAAMLEEAVDKMTRLKQQELKEKVADFDAEYKMRSLDVKQRIAEVKYGYGRKYDAPARPASPPPPAPEYAPPTAEQAASTGPENGTESPQSWFSTPAAEKSVPPAAEESVPPTPEESPLLIAESEPESAPALSPYAQARARVAAAPRTAARPPPPQPPPPRGPPPPPPAPSRVLGCPPPTPFRKSG
ncbi:MAG: HEAT repeat domain-containing protein, partial [Bacteroidota bacterium]